MFPRQETVCAISWSESKSNMLTGNIATPPLKRKASFKEKLEHGLLSGKIVKKTPKVGISVRPVEHDEPATQDWKF